MKKQITFNLAALLLGSAILFTSCKKETLEMPKRDASINAPIQSSNATIPLLKGVKTWQECGGGSFKPKMATQAAFIISSLPNGTEAKYVRIELYAKSATASVPSIWTRMIGNSEGATLAFPATPGASYYAKVSPYPYVESCWIPLMQYGVYYLLETSKNGTVLTVSVTPP